jgi:hypothetical protein
VPVMAGLDPGAFSEPLARGLDPRDTGTCSVGIYASQASAGSCGKGVDARPKAGHDELSRSVVSEFIWKML